MILKNKSFSSLWPNLENIRWFEQNGHVLSFWRWIFIKNEELPFITFTFMSRKHTSNIRCMNLNFYSKEIRIVLFKGSRIAKLDFFVLKSINVLIRAFSWKINKCYRGMYFYGIPDFSNLRVNQFLHLDDPAYTQSEFVKLTNWESNAKFVGIDTKIIVTNSYTTSKLKENGISSEIIEISQGFSEITQTLSPPVNEFNCVYASAYVAYGSDKNSKNTTWGVNFLIEELLPKAKILPEEIKICIIGNIGANARKELLKFKNVKLFPYMSQNEITNFLQTCKVGLYPRTFDHKRRILKVYSYLTASLPVVSLDLDDVADVKDYRLGLVVNDASEFVMAILKLYENDTLYSDLKKNIESFKIGKDWSTLSSKLESAVSKI